MRGDPRWPGWTRYRRRSRSRWPLGALLGVVLIDILPGVAIGVARIAPKG
jgi:hypothetical protein